MQRHLCGLSSGLVLVWARHFSALGAVRPKMQSNKNSRCFQLEGQTDADLPRWKSQNMHDCANFHAGYLAMVWAVRCVACDPLFSVSIFAYGMRW